MENMEILYYSWRILKWKFGNKSPILASIKLTYQCNLKCIHCGWTSLDRTDEISAENWNDIFKILYQLGIRIIVLEGGEPTLRQDLQEIILYAKKIGFKVILVTNGTNSLDTYTPDLIMISIDGIEEIHDEIRGKNTFKKMKSNLTSANTKKMALTTLNKKNIFTIENILEDLENLVDLFGFNIMYSHNDNLKDIGLSKTEIKDAYEKLLNLSNNYNIINTRKMMETIDWECSPWLMVLCEPDGKWKEQRTCFIDYLGQQHSCEECELACYKGLSLLSQGNLNSWYIINRYLFA